MGEVRYIYEWQHILKISVNRKAIKISFQANSQFVSQCIYYLKSCTESECIYSYAKSYLEFYCSRYLPNKSIKRPLKASFLRSKSFVVEDNDKSSKWKSQASTTMHWDSMSVARTMPLQDLPHHSASFIHRPEPTQQQSPSLHNSMNANNCPQKQRINLGALKRGLE